jgi:hypothetical protein
VPIHDLDRFSLFTRNGVEDTSLSSSEQGKAFNSKPGHDRVRMIVGGRISWNRLRSWVSPSQSGIDSWKSHCVSCVCA